MKRVPAALLLLVLAACASPPAPVTYADLEPLFPYLYALDPAAPVAVFQRPFANAYFGDDLTGPGVNTFGVTMELWPDHAVLTMDATPLALQLRGVRRFSDPAKQATRIRRNRWTVEPAQCPAITELYSRAMSIRESARTAAEVPPFTSAGGITLQFAGEEWPTEKLGFYERWLGDTWQALDKCTNASGRN